MITVHMSLYKINGVQLFGKHTEVVYISYTMATWDSPDICPPPSG